jgi:hypothetical protein
MQRKPIEQKFEIASPNILRELFKPEHLLRTIRRMRAWQEVENEVTHPLRRAILLEYGEELSQGVASAVASGTWKASAAYIILISKRSGTYREIVFPGLLDVVVVRHVIDALEPYITANDNGKVFCGRSHANAKRQRGDMRTGFKFGSILVQPSEMHYRREASPTSSILTSQISSRRSIGIVQKMLSPKEHRLTKAYLSFSFTA